MNLINWLTSPTAEALGWTLIHALWQGFAVVLTVALLLHLTRRSQASLRYQLGMSGLLAQVLASVLTFSWYYEPRSGATSGTMSQPGFRTSLLQMTPANESWLATTQGFLNAHLAEVVWIWLVGIAVFGVRLIGGWAYVQRLKTTATLPVPAMLTEVMARITPKLAVSARLQLSARATGPMVVGVLKPVVLWPVGLLAGLSMADVEAILAHELAHVRRHDYLLNVLQSVVEVLYFFHPALWWLSARVREEREHCCDDVAVNLIGDARALARALARVEEWQRSAEAVPTLAMGFASKRQLLLQRVQRMLGVPTRPLVSNGSLAGLTLVTMLFLSVSVYAVGRTEEPKIRLTNSPKPKPIQTARRHTVDKNSEYGMTNGGQITYVVWKGKKLPPPRIARLQTQLDQVMNGQLNLDAVKQPDRDILLTVIEKNVAFDAGMKALSEGMAHIDYSNIVADETTTIPGSRPVVELIDSVQVNRKWVKASHFYQRIDGSIISHDTLDRRRALSQRQLDSLSQLMHQQYAKMEALQLRMEKEQFAVEAFERQQQTLNWKRENLLQQRQKWLQKHEQLLSNDKPKTGQQLDVEKLVADNEQKIKESEQAVEGVLKQLEAMNSELEKARQPLRDLERQSDQLNRMSEQLSEQMSRHDEHINRVYNHNMRLNETLNLHLNEDLNRAETIRANKYLRSPEFKRSMRSTFPPKPPRPAVAPRAPRPSVNVTPAIAPTPPPAPARAPRPTPAPRIAPVPAPAPAPKAPK